MEMTSTDELCERPCIVIVVLGVDVSNSATESGIGHDERNAPLLEMVSKPVSIAG